MAWQSWENGRAFIRLGTAFGEFQRAESIDSARGNAWSPSLAIDREGNIAVAYDTYEAGNYDVRFTRFDAEGKLRKTMIVANSPRYEARPTVAFDPKGRAWIAYEERTANWGKDAENLVKGKGTTLYSRATVKVKCVDGERVLEVADPQLGMSDDLKTLNSFPRIACDDSGHVSLAFRHRQEAIWGNQAVMVVGGVWVEYLTALSGRSWSTPQPLPRSDGLLDNRPTLVPSNKSGTLVVYSSDGRLHREVEFTPELAWKYYSHSGTPPGVVDNDVFLAALDPPARWERSEPSAVQAIPQELAPPDVHDNEAADVDEDAQLCHQGGRQNLRALSRRFSSAYGNLARRWKRRRARRHVALRDRRRRVRLDGRRRPRQRRWQGIHLVARSEDDRSLPQSEAHHPVHLRTERRLSPRPPQRHVSHAGRAHVASTRRERASGRRRHRHALWLFEGTRRHLRLAYVGHRHGHRLARRGPDV